MKPVEATMSLAERLSKIEQLLLEWLSSQASKTGGEQYLTIGEAADLLCKSIHTLYGMVSRREIPHIKKGNRLYFNEQELIKWLQEGERLPVGLAKAIGK